MTKQSFEKKRDCFAIARNDQCGVLQAARNDSEDHVARQRDFSN
jgi:hypothetical protein